jgi:predicted nucleic acid-binding protein
MTSWVVADSGIYIASVLIEPFRQKAISLIQYWQDQSLSVAAPVLFQYEVVAVMRKHVVRGTITPQLALSYRDALLSVPISYVIDDLLVKRAYELATLYNRPTAYDSQYLAVAERLNCEFWTADERLYNALSASLGWVKFIGNFIP